MPKDQQTTAYIEVPKIVTNEKIRTYIDDGYLVVPELVTNDELDVLKADVTKLARGEYPADNLQTLSAQTTDEEVAKHVLCIHNPHAISPVILKYAIHSRICGVLSQITAAHLAHWDGSVKLMQSMFFVKPPDFQGQAWHQDEVYIPTRDRSLIGAWIAIDDANIDNGCLRVLPGSHRSGYLYPQRPHNRPNEFDLADESFGDFDESSEVLVEVKAGSVVFFNSHLLHRAYKNRSKVYRRALVNHYMNAWSQSPWRPQEGVKIAKTDFRAITPVAGIDPYAWRGTDATPQEWIHMRLCQANESTLKPPKDA